MNSERRRGDNVTVSPASAQANISAIAFHFAASDFLAAATQYAPRARDGSTVVHFLCCQSIELSLKAFLLVSGLSRRELRGRKYGHQLDELFEEALRRGLSQVFEAAPSDPELIRISTGWYVTDKRLQYVDVLDLISGLDGMPGVAGLLSLAERLSTPTIQNWIVERA